MEMQTSFVETFANVLRDDAVWPFAGFPARPTDEQIIALVDKISELHVMPCGKGFIALVQSLRDPESADVHSGFLPSVRGRQALDFCKEVYNKSRFSRFVTWCEPSNVVARRFAITVGFRSHGDLLVLTKG